jgi:hypothetical protein
MQLNSHLVIQCTYLMLILPSPINGRSRKDFCTDSAAGGQKKALSPLARAKRLQKRASTMSAWAPLYKLPTVDDCLVHSVQSSRVGGIEVVPFCAEHVAIKTCCVSWPGGRVAKSTSLSQM